MAKIHRMIQIKWQYMNSMICHRSVQPVAGGLPGQNTVWTTEFRALQHD
jgi:hypothetical protein